MIDGKRVLAVTLARGGSKGIPGKNIVEIAGEKLINFTIREALASRYIDRYIVSTDCPDIESVVGEMGVETPFRRPSHLASDTASSADALLHAVEYLEEQGEIYDVVVELMVTNPLKRAEHIDSALELLIEKRVPFCVAVQRLYDHHPSRIKYLQDGLMKDFFPEVLESRRQDLSPEAYIRAGSIYCMTTEALKQHRARYGKDNTAAYVLPDDSVVNIDEPIDLLVAENLIRKNFAG